MKPTPLNADQQSAVRAARVSASDPEPYYHQSEVARQIRAKFDALCRASPLPQVLLTQNSALYRPPSLPVALEEVPKHIKLFWRPLAYS